MNIIERAQTFVQWLSGLEQRRFRRCPNCESTLTIKWGHYERHPWFFQGRKTILVQRHRCRECDRTYGEPSSVVSAGSWYSREVHRCAIDHWQHLGTSLRRTAEVLRSWLGRQERWLMWRPLDEADDERCYLNASTIHRWLKCAGKHAKQDIAGQLEGVASSGQVGTDGLWARLKGKSKKVVLAVVDSVSGLVYPPVVEDGEESVVSWERMFVRAEQAGLRLDELRGVVSDGAKGLIGYVNTGLWWVNHQRCVFHLWRTLSGELAAALKAASVGLADQVAKAVGKQVRKELVVLMREVFNAPSEATARTALVALAAHHNGHKLAQAVQKHLEAALVHRIPFNQGLMRVSPEWRWRDFRLRLSRGRNHRSSERLEQAALVWAIYRNFTPAQWRCERKRKYRHPGLSPLEVAGVKLGRISYLDALGV